MFQRLYLETSALIAAGWPHLSADLVNVLKWASMLKIDVLLPAPVEEELEHHWVRELEEKAGKIKSAGNAFARYVNQVGASGAEITLPEQEECLRLYRDRVAEMKKRWGLGVIPITSRRLEDLFSMSAIRRPPFRDKDVGFRDTVIYLSVIEHLRGAGEVNGAFVAQDAIFRDADAARLARENGVVLEVYGSVKEVYDAMIGSLKQAVRERWETERRVTKERLSASLGEFQAFIEGNLVVSERELAGFRTMRALRRIEASQVTDVRTPGPLDRRDDERVKVSFDVEIDFHILVDAFLPAAPRVFRVGETSTENLAEISRTRTGLFWSSEGRTEEIAVRGVVEIEATAVYRMGGYGDFSFEAVRLKPTSGFGLLSALGEVRST